MKRIELQEGYSISRVIKGGWHLAGGHGNIDSREAIEDMKAFVEAGITTFDCADIYTGVEEMIGAFLKKYKMEFSNGSLPPVEVHTKYVPDYNSLSTLTKSDTERIIDRSLKRLGVERLDMVQFAWWDVKIQGWIETAVHLSELQKAGKIRFIGLTNFNSTEVKSIIDAGVEIITNQIQYSVLDNRPSIRMEDLSQEKGFKFLCYGVLAGGFLSERYFRKLIPSPPHENRSLTKYQLIIEDFGGAELFQETLEILNQLAEKHDKSIAQIACQYILQKQGVAAIIVGARNKKHLSKYSDLDIFHLTEEDIQLIRSIQSKAIGPSGAVYELERDKTGRHGSIMKYNLNEE